MQYTTEYQTDLLHLSTNSNEVHLSTNSNEVHGNQFINQHQRVLFSR